MRISRVIALVLLAIAVGSVWKLKMNRSTIEGAAVLSDGQPSKIKDEASIAAHISAQAASLADEAKNIPPTPEQQDIVSNSLPSLTWRKVEQDLSKARVMALSMKAKDIVVGKLKDPESARFKESKVLAVADPRGHRYFICGLVNAKNSFGGYTGFQDYVFEARPDSAEFTLEGGIGAEGHVASMRFDDRWWKYEADDVCLSEGTQIE